MSTEDGDNALIRRIRTAHDKATAARIKMMSAKLELAAIEREVRKNGLKDDEDFNAWLKRHSLRRMMS